MEQPNELLVKKVHPEARLPERAYDHAAGYDLFSCEDRSIARGERIWIRTGLEIAIPSQHYGRVAARSSLADRYVDTGAGVIDEDYRGEVCVLLINSHREATFDVRTGDKIAQLVLERISTPPVREVQELPLTRRGKRGFGSSGLVASPASANVAQDAVRQPTKLPETVECHGCKKSMPARENLRQWDADLQAMMFACEDCWHGILAKRVSLRK